MFSLFPSPPPFSPSHAPSLPTSESQAAAYEFTTLTCIPGNIIYNDTKIQLLDLPGEKGGRAGESKRRSSGIKRGHSSFSTTHAGDTMLDFCSHSLLSFLCPLTNDNSAGIIEGAAHGKGRGREVIAVARSSDLVLMVLDGGKEQVNNHRAILERELETVGLRLNKKPPNIYFKKKKDGGVKFNSTVRLIHPSLILPIG